MRVGGQFEGYRYLCCSLCSTQWHMVRVMLALRDVESVAYQAIEGRSEAIKAETCHSYRKIFYQDKDLHVEPVADDLASLMLDVLVGEAGYARASGNPCCGTARRKNERRPSSAGAAQAAAVSDIPSLDGC